LGYSDDRQLLVDAGVDVDGLDAGCCSLAGNFGFENGHYDVSVAGAEAKLMPAVRNADPDTLILADGFSYRTQIRELATDRKPMHLAQVIAAALSAHEGDTRATQIVDE
jgi:Fe-S oxidoreductase